MMMGKRELRVHRPVRRKLFAISMAYIVGIYVAQAVCLSEKHMYILCALLLCAAVYQIRHRKHALLFVMAAMFFFGNYRAGEALRVRDTATRPGIMICGTVSRIESDSRVHLQDVILESEQKLERPVAVTLMVEKDKEGNAVGESPSVAVGQKISGTGRLFEQDKKRNPGGVDWRIQALCKGYDLSGYLLPGWTVEGKGRFSIMEVFRIGREHLAERIDALFGEHAPLFSAIIIGNKSDMDDELIAAMRLTGIVHILTISGMHMSLMAALLRKVLAKLRIRRTIRFFIQVLLLGGYVCLTGFAIGTIRAYIMSNIRLLSEVKGRRYEPLTALGAAALIMTLVCPLWALSTSFQFSFFIVLGILLLSGQLSRLITGGKRWPKGIRRMAMAAVLTTSAQITAAPIQLMYYGYIPLLAMPMNLISGLFVPVMMVGGWFALGISMYFQETAYSLARILSAFAIILEKLCLFAAELPWGIARLPSPHTFTMVLILFLLFLSSNQIYIAQYRKRYCGLLTVAALLLYLIRFDPSFQYVQLDVGQGDSAVFRQSREAVLVDVGPSDEYAALRYLRHEGLLADLVILTHADEDHAGALCTLIDSEIEFGRIALPTGALDDKVSMEVEHALKTARDKGVKIEFYERGDVISSGKMKFSVLSPDQALSGSNERSLVLYTENEGIRILTLGDLPESGEMRDVPACDVMKVAHHGSRYATSRTLLNQAMPETAIISVGRNSYGHPSDRVLEDLSDIGAEVFRTDQNGCITVKREAQTYSVKTQIH